MPTRTAGPPLGLPGRFIFLGFLPKSEVLGALFITLKLRKGTFTFHEELLRADSGIQDTIKKTTIIFVLLDVKIDAAIGFVSEAVVNDFLDEIDDFGDVFGHAGQNFGQFYIQVSK